jgi:glutathione peroxidase-family protein
MLGTIQVLLVVNVATYWGFTEQYIELNALQEELADNLAILAFPCNQFGKVNPLRFPIDSTIKMSNNFLI